MTDEIIEPDIDLGLGENELVDNAVDTRSGLGNTFWNIGAVAAIGGSVIASIGAYASTQAEEENLKSGASSQESAAVFDDYGANQARIAAQDVVRQGRRTKGRYQLRAAQEQSSARASAAARGVEQVGSAAEVQASLKYAQEVDELTLDSNTLRQRQALERQELSLRNRARMRRVSAENMRRSASTISPGLAAATASLQGIAGVAGGFAQRFA